MAKARCRDMKDTQTLLLALVDRSRALGNIVPGCMPVALLVIMTRKPQIDVRLSRYLQISGCQVERIPAA